MPVQYSEAISLVDQLLEIEIDRPMGSRHPSHGFIYPVNYGFVPGIEAPDGEDLDAYLLGVFEPVDRYSGRCIALIRRTHEDDDKMIVVPDGRQYTDDQILALTEFQEGAGSPAVLRTPHFPLPSDR